MDIKDVKEIIRRAVDAEKEIKIDIDDRIHWIDKIEKNELFLYVPEDMLQECIETWNSYLDDKEAKDRRMDFEIMQSIKIVEDAQERRRAFRESLIAKESTDNSGTRKQPKESKRKGKNKNKEGHSEH